MVDAPGGQADQADPFLELSLPVQLQQRDVVVQRLAVVVVVDVGRGHSQCLGPGAAVLPRQVVVPDSHVDRVPGPHDAARKALRRAEQYLN